MQAIVFSVTLDPSKTLYDAIVDANLESWDVDTDEELFPHRKALTGTDVVLEIVHFGRAMRMSAIKAELKRLGLRPANLTELIAYAAEHPYVKEDLPLVALDSPLMRRLPAWRPCPSAKNRDPFPHGGCSSCETVLYQCIDWHDHVGFIVREIVDDFDGMWPASCRFLAVRM